MKGSVRVVPAFGLAAFVVAQPCGCWEVKAMVGPVELGLIEGRWCRNKEAFASLPPPDPLEMQLEILRQSGAPEWKIAAMRDGLKHIMELPPAERMAAMQELIAELEPEVIGAEPPK